LKDVLVDHNHFLTPFGHNIGINSIVC